MNKIFFGLSSKVLVQIVYNSKAIDTVGMADKKWERGGERAGKK